MGYINKEDYIDLDFGRFRDCRIVKTEDARGQVREGLFIPFMQNYITKRKASGVPHLMMKVFEIKNNKSKRVDGNTTHILLPSCPKVMRDMLVENGYLDPNAKQWSPIIGYIYRNKPWGENDG